MKGELAAVASQYAEATLELAEAADSGQGAAGTTAQRVLEDLKAIREVFEKTEELNLVLRHPAVPAENKKALLIKTFEGKVSDITLRLLHLLADRRRVEIIEAVEEKYEELIRIRQNIVRAELFCSEPLSQADIADIKARLTEHLGKRLELQVEVDRSLLGGLVLKIGDQVIDGSLKGKLQEIEKELTAV